MKLNSPFMVPIARGVDNVHNQTKAFVDQYDRQIHPTNSVSYCKRDIRIEMNEKFLSHNLVSEKYILYHINRCNARHIEVTPTWV